MTTAPFVENSFVSLLHEIALASLLNLTVCFWAWFLSVSGLLGFHTAHPFITTEAFLHLGSLKKLS